MPLQQPVVSPALYPETPADIFEPDSVYLESAAGSEQEFAEENEDLEQDQPILVSGDAERTACTSLCARSHHESHHHGQSRAWWNSIYHSHVVQQVWPRSASKLHPQKVARWWYISKHYCFQWMALAAFVLLSANDTIIKSKSKRRLDGDDQPRDFPYAPSSVLLVGSFVSLVTGSLTAFAIEGMPGLRQCWNPASLWRMTPVSVLFHLSFVLKFVTLRYLPPDMVNTLSQVNLVLLALALRFVLKKRYSSSQWTALLTITSSMLLYCSLRDGGRKGRQPANPLQLSNNVHIGLLTLLLMGIFETGASVLCEKYFKERRDHKRGPQPFYIQKVHVDFSGLLVSALWCYVLEPHYLYDLNWTCKGERCRQVIDKGLFYGWDRMTVVVLCLVVVKMWLAGLVAKILDSVVKQLGSCVAMVLTYLEVLWLNKTKDHYDFETSLALAVMVMGIAQFTVVTRDRANLERLLESRSVDDAHCSGYSGMRSRQ